MDFLWRRSLSGGACMPDLESAVRSILSLYEVSDQL